MKSLRPTILLVPFILLQAYHAQANPAVCPDMDAGAYMFWTVTAMAEPGETVRMEPFFSPASGEPQRLAEDCLGGHGVSPATAGRFALSEDGRVVLIMSDGLAEDEIVTLSATYPGGHDVSGTIRIDYGE